MYTAMTIAGSDSSGGAGVQADLKAFASIGVHGTTTITCITAQNTKGVTEIYPLPIEVIMAQFDAVMDDISPVHIKTGMLYSSEIVRFVAREIKNRKLVAIVDPVMISTTGARLAKEDFSSALKRELIPVATMLTPNLDEAEALTGKKLARIGNDGACKELWGLGAKYVLLKGGHAKGREVVDILYDGKRFTRFSSKRIGTAKSEFHGTGCTISAYIAGYLARGLSIEDAVSASKNDIERAILHSYRPGKGVSMIDQLACLEVSKDKLRIIVEMRKLSFELENILIPEMIPEVGTNVGYALASARVREDVCAYDGRIMKVGGRVRVFSCPAFGSSKHVANIVLAAMRYDEEIRCAANIRYSKLTLAAVKKAGLSVANFSRKDEPPSKDEKISTMEWGTSHAIEHYRKEHGNSAFPDVIYDDGGEGKEPMVRILARNPKELVNKLSLVVKAYIKMNARR